MQVQFVHLRLHTEYSLVDGTVRIKPLMRRLAETGMPAVAITDQSNLFGMVKFYRAAVDQGIKPVVGVDLLIEEADGPPSRLVLLCQNDAGYRNLTRVVTRSYLEGQHRGHALVRREWLESASEGLIALSGGREGDIGRALLAGHEDAAEQALKYWLELFPDRFYLELQRTRREHDEPYNDGALGLALAFDAPVVATNDVRFIDRAEFEAHEARVCIHEGRTLADPRRPRHYSVEQYLKTPEEMAELFADLPEALENTVEIARRCNLGLTFGKNVLPEYPVPPEQTVESHLREEAGSGLAARLDVLAEARGAPIDEAERDRYRARLDHELNVIVSMGFPGYFLIVADFIRWARENGVPVGPGRGSGAGSLVAYALGITDLDPLEHDLLFERFLNPERVSMPDFDVDFCMDGRDRVIEYVADRYGRDRVSQIITYGTMAARAVVRDVGRVLGHPYGFVDRIAKQVPFAVGMTLEKALEESPDLKASYDGDEEVRYLIDMALSLEGIARNAGKHAGGVVISPSPLTDFTPLYCEPGGESLVTQFDKDDVEAVGLVKFDFLGLRTLTIIDRALAIVNRARQANGEEPIDLRGLSMDDRASFALLKEANTTAVFQLESAGMRKLIKELQPDCFEDIVALVALYRPGPLQSGMVVDFINRKHGRARVEYPHPSLEPILKPTYGIILYQEQVMQIAQVLSGYTLGGADLLRRAMGKKKPEIMAKERANFVQGAIDNGVQESTAAYIFDLVEKFAGYGFNKSHSAAYALVSYHTAWLKAHYPAAFMCAVLSSDMDHTDKVVMMIDECKRLGLDVLPPDINHSMYDFTTVGDSGIRYGLGAIKGVGEGAIEGMLAERERNGAYRNLYDFCRRIDVRRVNRRVLEALVNGGALDGLGPNRASLMTALPQALAMAEQHTEDAAAGQNDMFGLVPEAGEGAGDAAIEEVPEWAPLERLRAEKEVLGLYLTGHPIEFYQDDLRDFISGRISDLVAQAESGDETRAPGGRGRSRGPTVVVAGLVVDLRVMKAGRRAILTLDDRSGRLECALFEDRFHEYRELLEKDRLLIVTGSLSYDDYADAYRLNPQEVMGLEEARMRFASRVTLNCDDRRMRVDALEACLRQYAGEQGCPVSLRYRNRRARAEIMLDAHWRVRVCDGLLADLGRLFGREAVKVSYTRARSA